jgi:3-oxoacyl-[acyl-carrier-protein] synthase I
MTASFPLRIIAHTAVSALGAGLLAHEQALEANRSGLSPLSADGDGTAPVVGQLDTWVGRVDGLDQPLPAAWEAWDCRNHRLAWKALQLDGFAQAVNQAVATHGADRVAVVLGSTTSSVGATEAAYRTLDATGVFPSSPNDHRLHNLHALSAFVAEILGVRGPCFTVSTACSSSAKAFVSARRLLALGLADAVVVGGVDSLCGSTLFGFHALQLVSAQPCRPFDTDRNGINLGEAAGFALLERGHGGLQLLGCGESSDAHHLSAPQPEGLGMQAALAAALADAGRPPESVDYLHAHGTATPKNDAIEAHLIHQHFPHDMPVSSTKGLTGHTLGAAGILGAVFSLMAIERGVQPGTVGSQSIIPDVASRLLLRASRRTVRTAVSHAFAFGGSNCVLVFGRGETP